MAANLTMQVHRIAEVTTAVTQGDLSRKITVDVRGEILELKNTVNTMVDQLGSFAAEVTRVARRSRNRRKTRWPGRSTRRSGHLEGSYGQRELHGGQSYSAGA